MEIPSQETPKGGLVPAGVYTSMLVGVNNTPSSRKGTPQTSFEFLIAEPAEVEHGGEKYKTADKKFTISIWWTDKALDMALVFIRKLGIDPAKFANTDDLQKSLPQLVDAKLFVDVALESKPVFFRKTLTPDEVRRGVKPEDAEIYINPRNNQPVITGYRINVTSSHVQDGTVRYADRTKYPF